MGKLDAVYAAPNEDSGRGVRRKFQSEKSASPSSEASCARASETKQQIKQKPVPHGGLKAAGRDYRKRWLKYGDQWAREFFDSCRTFSELHLLVFSLELRDTLLKCLLKHTRYGFNVVTVIGKLMKITWLSHKPGHGVGCSVCARLREESMKLAPQASARLKSRFAAFNTKFGRYEIRTSQMGASLFRLHSASRVHQRALRFWAAPQRLCWRSCRRTQNRSTPCHKSQTTATCGAAFLGWLHFSFNSHQ